MRLIIDKPGDAFHNMGVDEAIMKSGIPTLRLYQWSPPAISIGYFQSLEAEVKTEVCKKQGIDIVRRITGGGAVFHDKELTYSLVMPEKNMPSEIIKSYEMICALIVNALRDLKIKASFHPINDILVKNKKISGNAQTRKQGMLLQHGTILLDVDVDRMFSLLKVPDEKMRGKLIKVVKERVTSVHETNPCITIVEVQQAIIRQFEKKIGSITQDTLTPEEEKQALKSSEKFSSKDWLRLR